MPRSSTILPEEWIPPHNEPAEQALLGAVLRRGAEALDAAAEAVSPDDFYVPAHQRLWQACLDIAARGDTVNAVTLAAVAVQDGELADVGGARYLADLVSGDFGTTDPRELARLVADLARRREMVWACEDLAGRILARDALTPAEDLAVEAAALFDGLAEKTLPRGRRTATSVVAHVERYVQRVVDVANGCNTPPVRSGIDAVDAMIGGGFTAPDLIALGARPSMGKTTFAETVAWSAAATKGVVFFSMEMSYDQLMAKACQRLTGIPAKRQLHGPIDADEVKDIVDARERLNLPLLHIVDQRALTPQQVKRHIRRIRRRQPVDFVIVDQINKMRSDQRAPNLRETISAIAHDMADVADAAELPLLLLCQLNRANEGRDNKRPQLSDLREAGAIEEASRMVLFLHREAYYLARAEPADHWSDEWREWSSRLAAVADKAEVILAKDHLGEAPATKTIAFDRGRQQFADPVDQMSML